MMRSSIRIKSRTNIGNSTVARCNCLGLEEKLGPVFKEMNKSPGVTFAEFARRPLPRLSSQEAMPFVKSTSKGSTRRTLSASAHMHCFTHRKNPTK